MLYSHELNMSCTEAVELPEGKFLGSCLRHSDPNGGVREKSGSSPLKFIKKELLSCEGQGATVWQRGWIKDGNQWKPELGAGRDWRELSVLLNR